MMKNFKIVIVLVLGSGLFCSCNASNRQGDLIEASKVTDPFDSFVELIDICKSNDGSIVDPASATVKWMNTKVFRLYEQKNFSVVAFPYNFSKDKFNIFFISGHLKKYDDMFRDIHTSRAKKDNTGLDYNFDGIKLKTNISPNKSIGIYGIYLGMSWQQVLDKVLKNQRKYCLSKGGSEKAIKQVLTYVKHTASSLKKTNPLTPIYDNWGRVQLKYEFHNDKLVWMCVSKNASLSSYSIFKYKLNVLSQGKFNIDKVLNKSRAHNQSQPQ